MNCSDEVGFVEIKVRGIELCCLFKKTGEQAHGELFEGKQDSYTSGNEVLRRLGLIFLSRLDMVKLRRLVASTG